MGKRYSCPHCSYSSAFNSGLRSHIKNNHEVAERQCNDCGEIFSTVGGLNWHSRLKHGSGVVYPCEHCDFVGPSPSRLQLHIEEKHMDNRYPCDHCDFVANTAKKLRSHAEIKHGVGFKLACDLCDFLTRFPSDLKRHKESKHEGVRYECEYCDYSSGRVSKL